MKKYTMNKNIVVLFFSDTGYCNGVCGKSTVLKFMTNTINSLFVINAVGRARVRYNNDSTSGKRIQKMKTPAAIKNVRDS